MVSIIRGDEYAGLSTDEKPIVGVSNGSIFNEMDTDTTYIYDASNEEWRVKSSGGGTPSPSKPKIRPLQVANNGVYRASSSIDGYSPVYVDVEPNLEYLYATENGQYYPSETDGFYRVQVSVTPPITIDQIAQKTLYGSIEGSYADRIGSYAFYECSGISAASFPNATILNEYAFYSCRNLSTINMSKVQRILPFAFYSCSSLQEASFPSATDIYTSAFALCSSLSTVYFPSVTEIRSDAFHGCINLTEASFPNASAIGQSAFQNCFNLEQVYFPSAKSVASDAFMNCSKITALDMPIVSFISMRAFMSCGSLQAINLPSVKTIGASAFASCISLSVASIPTVTTFENSAFYSCEKLLSVYMTSVTTVPNIKNKDVFVGTPIAGATSATGGVYGTVYVPSSLYASFINTDGWINYSSRIVSV